MRSTLMILVTLCLVCLLLFGCAGGAVVVGAVGGAVVAADERSARTMADDEAIELRANHALANEPMLKEGVHISVTSFNRVVLMTGQAVTPEKKEKAIDIVRHIAGVRRVHDAITIAEPMSMRDRLIDAGLTAQVKTVLLGSKGFRAARIKVVTEARTVYLMGITSRARGADMAAAVRQVDGVAKVAELFEYID